MKQLDAQAARNYPAGNGVAQSGNLSLPEGARELLITMTQPNWPLVSDGTITLRLEVSRGSGAPFVQEWSDTFQHKQVLRNGVPVPLQFGAQLAAPFGPQDRARYSFDSQLSFRSAISIDANIVAAAAR